MRKIGINLQNAAFRSAIPSLITGHEFVSDQDPECAFNIFDEVPLETPVRVTIVVCLGTLSKREKEAEHRDRNLPADMVMIVTLHQLRTVVEGQSSRFANPILVAA
ncbi:MAG: hypothetical protein V4438_02000 [Patescibacteria group bacterium]